MGLDRILVLPLVCQVYVLLEGVAQAIPEVSVSVVYSLKCADDLVSIVKQHIRSCSMGPS